MTCLHIYTINCSYFYTVLYVSLNQPEYTVREDEGELVVCISLQGNIDIIVHASNIQTSNVTAYENIGK